jgi:heat-inducible transcriptional repressor
MVVVITSTGGVTKKIFTFDRPVDPGLADWAASFFNERLVGIGLGASMLRRRLQDPSLGASEQAFLRVLTPAFTGLDEGGEDIVYVEGTARLLASTRDQDVSALNEIVDMLERRRSLLSVLRHALDERDVYVRIGAENESPALRPFALVAAAYGLPRRSLGTVAVMGPVRMDYATAIRSVRDAAAQLSSYIEDVYDES